MNQNSYERRPGNGPQWPMTPQQQLRYIAGAIGMAFISYMVLSMAVPMAADVLSLLIFGADRWTVSNILPPAVNELVNTLAYVAALLIPFWFLASAVGLKQGTLFAPSKKSAGYQLACIGLCIGAASVGNIFAEVFSQITSIFGYVPYYQPVGFGDGVVSNIIIVLTSTVLAGLLEEFAFRGALLRMLRPYGDGFALVVSALLFGICHPSAAQFFPAVITGLALGYVVISTGSILTSVIAHMAYNTIALLGSYAVMQLPTDQLASLATVLVTAAMLAAGLWGTIYLCKQEDCFKLQESASPLTLKQKIGALVTSLPLMLISIVFLGIALTSFVPVY